MSAATRLADFVSVVEYLELEAASQVKYEYVHGVLRAFAGGTDRHSEIAVNLITALRTATRGGPCRVYASGMKVSVADDVYYYPAVSVVCDNAGQSPLLRTNPVVLVEILSQRTALIDRREKLANYLRLESLRDYLMIAQDDQWVEHHWRDDSGAWQHETLVHDGVVRVAFLNLDLPLTTIYEDLSPPPVPGSDEPRYEV